MTDELRARTLEPEVMDDPAGAAAYARADFSQSNQAFVDRFFVAFPACRQGRVLDVGCGPADIAIRMAKAAPALRVTGVDASASMLRLARRAVEDAGLGGRIELVQSRLPDPALPAAAFDAVLSSSALHHFPDPSVFWKELRRLGKPGAAIFVIDLYRPASKTKAREIVEAAASAEDPLLKEDFYNSLLAAFTVEEVREQLSAAKLPGLTAEIVSERHWLVAGRLG